MCGIIGEFCFNGIPKTDWLENSLKKIEHRGPDNSGYVVDNNLSLGHRRLSILDLSENGNQPFQNPISVITYNGEIYNYKQLIERFSLQEIVTDTDTEVLQKLLDNSLSNISELRGMFAFAYYSKVTKCLYLVRDEFGIKPLYYHISENRLVFCSEIGPIIERDDFEKSVNSDALNEHLLLGYSIGNKTLFNGVNRVLPGEILKISPEGLVVSKFYNRITESSGDAPMDIDHVLRDTVETHSVADVPLGLMLSGGFDSNLLLSFINPNLLNSKLLAFNAGSDKIEDQNLYLERIISQEIAERYNANLVKIGIRGFDHDYVKEVFDIMEEPICNPSALLIHTITRQARDKGIKILFSGHGGDELFAGYRRHVAAKVLDDFKMMKYFIPKRLIKMFNRFPDIQRILAALKSNGEEPLYLNMIGFNFLNKGILILPNSEVTIENIAKRFDKSDKKLSILERILACEYPNYLAAQNLINMDKVSMSNSVEVRVPFIDKEFYKFLKIKEPKNFILWFKGKLPLRELAKKRLPSSIFELKKSGFSPDLNSIVTGSYAQDLLLSESHLGRGFSNQRKIKSLIKSSKRTASDNMMLFNLMIIEHWFQKYID